MHAPTFTAEKFRVRDASNTIEVSALSVVSGALQIGDPSLPTSIVGSSISVPVPDDFLFGDGTAALPAIAFASDPSTGFSFVANYTIQTNTAGVGRIRANDVGQFMKSDYQFGWLSGAVGTPPDTILQRDAANVLALKNATTAQEFRVYGTTTGPKYLSLSHNGSTGVISTNSTDLQITPATSVMSIINSTNVQTLRVYKTDAAGAHWLNLSGAGVVRTEGADDLLFGVNGSNYWGINNATAVFGPTADNNVDLGSSGGRIRTGYFGTSVVTPALGTITDATVSLNINSVSRWAIGNAASTYAFYAATDNAYDIGLSGGNRPRTIYTATSIVSPSFVTTTGTLMASSTNLTNGAAAQVGTLTNAPAAGNPTKWILINDNGTSRYIPAW